MSWETTPEEECHIHVITGVRAAIYSHSAHGPPGVGTEVAAVFRYSYAAVRAISNGDYAGNGIPVGDDGLPATWCWIARVCPPAKLLSPYGPEMGPTPEPLETIGWAFSPLSAKPAAEAAIRRMWQDHLPDAPQGSFSRTIPGSKK